MCNISKDKIYRYFVNNKNYSSNKEYKEGDIVTIIPDFMIDGLDRFAKEHYNFFKKYAGEKVYIIKRIDFSNALYKWEILGKDIPREDSISPNNIFYISNDIIYKECDVCDKICKRRIV